MEPVTDTTDALPPAEGLLTIGAFAARARLSPKALRLYDRLGLLRPAHVDDTTGYRYYRAAQVERARLVFLLRGLDMPLARIAEVVERQETDGQAAADLVTAYWADVEERLAGQRTLAHYLRGRLSGRSSELYATFEVHTVDVPEQWVITETRHTLVEELPVWIPASLGRLEAAAKECGGTTGAPFVVYHSEVSQESDGPVESCVPVADPEAARTWAVQHARAWNTTARLEPAHRLAYTRITKAQVANPQIHAAYEAVEAWLTTQNLPYTAPCREIYFTDWDESGPEDEVCDVAFPF
ncbi:MerR family transcriptional regulator [Streptomyces phaeochromogenes]|uniref:MerR family transcriptional regulator n=1 Tax=Streptomyces phaeochromogenes TaxID=1923 RepID=UPI00386FC4D0|nr:MerR family transcriptional regulator [Streptomyces phaeochromogenes]